jgi:Arc/MetJ-type ribon-helix-helix transcriptional regulator
MSKITFRADDDLVARLEEFDASKSEVMRQALRAYLDGADGGTTSDAGGVDGAIADRVDRLVAERLDERLPARAARREGRDINVNVRLDGMTDGNTVERTAENAVGSDARGDVDASGADVDARKTDAARSGSTSDGGAGDGKTPRNTCAQCGENMDAEHVYCPNCGEKSSHRVFCDCGDELRSDWAFCPSCGRRTPAAEVLDQA